MSDTVRAEPFSAASFNKALAEGKLMGARCSECGVVHLPPRPICASCRSTAMEWVELSGKGTLAAFTSIYVPPSAMAAQGYDRAKPYLSGIVKLAEGPHFSARILGLDATQPDLSWIGTPLVASYRLSAEDEAGIPLLAFARV